MPRQRSPRPDRRHQAGGAISDPPAGDIGQLAALLNQAGAGGRGRRSSLARWLHTHHDAFAVMLADKRPVWEDVATALAARDRTQSGPTAPPDGLYLTGVGYPAEGDPIGQSPHTARE